VTRGNSSSFYDGQGRLWLPADGAPRRGRRAAATRNGHDWASRFPLIVEAVTALKAGSCLIDGEAVCCDDNGMAVFAKLRQRRNDRHVLLYAFDLLEPTARICGANRWSDARYCWRGCSRGQVCKVFQHACKMGLEGIVSKRLGSRYVSGRTRDWLKMKNPDAPAVKRDSEEEWGR
jgi:bifunctional non-homologous end joining protein LigD